MRTKFILVISAIIIIALACEKSDFVYNDSNDSSNNGSTGTSGSLARFATVGNYLYTVDPYSLKVYDISNETRPMFLNQISASWFVESIFALNGHLFLGTQNGVLVYNTKDNPKAPTFCIEMSHIRSYDPVVVTKDGKYAFSTLHSNDNWGNNQLDIYSINYKTNTIESMSWVKTINMVNPKGLGLHPSDTILYICDSQLEVYNVKNPTNPVRIGSQNITGAYDVIPMNDYILVGTENGLYLYGYNSDGSLNLLSSLYTKSSEDR